jgi:iron complex outermembrane receptor protein
MNLLPRPFPRSAALLSSSVLLAALLPAQTAPESRTSSAPGEVVNLSAFEVSATQGSGYRTSNSVTGTKSSKRLIDIPASVAVITRDFMDDMISDQTIGDVLKYAVAGAPPSTNRNNFLQIRGQRFESPWTDGIRVSNSPNELSVIDSIEVLKGVNSVLYGTRVPAGGLVNRITKKPQVRSYNAVKLMYGDYDFRRAEIDTTGAIPQTGDRFAYRFIGAKQDYAGYRGRRDQDAYAPMLQYSSGGTTVRHQYIWSETYTPGELPGGIANADGSVFLEGGQRQDYKAPWSFTRKETGVHTTTWLQEIGSWESRVAYMAEVADRDDEAHHRQGAANLVARTSPHRYFGQTESRRFESLQQDLVGAYTIGAFRVDTSIGWSINREILNQGRQEINLANGQAIGAYSRPTRATPGVGLLNIVTPNLASIPLPGFADRIRWGEYDTRTVVTGRTVYAVQAFDVVPDRLAVTLGASFANEDSSVHQLPGAPQGATQPEARRTDKSDDQLYSIGAVYSLTPRLKLFASTGTTFSPNQANATTPAGLRPPPVTGESFETGLKFNLLEDRLWGSVTLYRLDLKGFATFNSVINAFDVTDTYNDGMEIELWYEPIRGLQFIGTLFDADVHGPNNARVNQSYENAWSIWSRLAPASGRFKGLYVGAGLFHRGTLIYSSGANAPGYTTLDMTAGYSSGDWSVSVSGRNLTDEVYNIGSTGSANIDPSTPASWQMTLTRRF